MKTDMAKHADGKEVPHAGTRGAHTGSAEAILFLALATVGPRLCGMKWHRIALRNWKECAERHSRRASLPSSRVLPTICMHVRSALAPHRRQCSGCSAVALCCQHLRLAPIDAMQSTLAITALVLVTNQVIGDGECKAMLPAGLLPAPSGRSGTAAATHWEIWVAGSCRWKLRCGCAQASSAMLAASHIAPHINCQIQQSHLLQCWQSDC